MGRAFLHPWDKLSNDLRDRMRECKTPQELEQVSNSCGADFATLQKHNPVSAIHVVNLANFMIWKFKQEANHKRKEQRDLFT